MQKLYIQYLQVKVALLKGLGGFKISSFVYQLFTIFWEND